MERLKRLAVFCGSVMGKDHIYKTEAEKLGIEMAKNSITLVYGGGNRGLMGVVAHAVHDNGGKVIGVLPKAMIRPSVTDGQVEDEVYIEDGMHQRKKRMYSLSDGFVALPGGIGTIEEISEIFTWRQLGYTSGNVALYNINGYWDPFLNMLDKAVEDGFLSEKVRESLIVVNDTESLFSRLDNERVTLPDKLKCNMRKLKLNRQAFIDWIYIIFGTFLTGFGISVFMNPARLAPGGVSGLGTIIYHVIEDKTGKTMELGLIILFLSIPIYLLGLAVFGKEYGIRTLMGTLLLSLSTFIFDSIFPNGIIDYSKESSLWLCTLFTGLTNGIGIGLVMRTGSNTGGTDIIAQILARYTPLGMGNALLFVDGTVILSSIFIFGIENALYSAVVSIIISLIIDRVIVPFGTNYAKTVYIISPHIDIIGEYILKNMNRSGTIIPSRGLFSGENKEMLMTVIPKKDLTKLTRCVKEADPNAFLVIQDTYHVLGEGYQPLDVIADSKDVSQS